MGLFQSNSPSLCLFLFAIVGCLTLLIQVPCTEAALQCTANERYVSKTFKGNWQLKRCDDSCLFEIRTQCQKDINRVVSKMKCNWWDPRTGSVHDEYSTCEGCCGKSLTTHPPAITTQCQAGERYKTYTLSASRPWNCSLCEDKCKSEIGPSEELARDTCVLKIGSNTYTCRCCFKNKNPPLPPPPPPHTLPPSPPINHCKLCVDHCEQNCSKLGRTMASQCCIFESSSVHCKCRCTKNKPALSGPQPLQSYFHLSQTDQEKRTSC